MNLHAMISWLILLSCTSLIQAQDRDGSFRLTPGSYVPADLLEQTFSEGNISAKGDVLILQGGGKTNLPRMVLRLDDGCLNKYYKITVTAYGNGRSAQIMLTEGFRWNLEPVQRFWRTRLEKADDFINTTVFLHVEQTPFFLNFGLLPNEGPELFMRVKSLVMEEIDEMTYRHNIGYSEITVPDRPHNVNVQQALKRFTDNAERLLKADFLPPELREMIAKNVAAVANLTWQGQGEVPQEVEEILSKCETLGVMVAQKSAPAVIPVSATPLRLTIYNLHSPHSVWARFEADTPGVEYRVVRKSGEKFRLNQGNLAIIPAYEPAMVEVTGLNQPNQLRIFPLDHHGKNTVTTITVE